MYVLKKTQLFNVLKNLNLNGKCATNWWKRCKNVNANNWQTSGKIFRCEWMIFLSYGIKKLTKKHGIFNHSELKFLKKCKTHSEYTSRNLAKLGPRTQVFMCSTFVPLFCCKLVTDTYSVTKRRCKLKAPFLQEKKNKNWSVIHPHEFHIRPNWRLQAFQATRKTKSLFLAFWQRETIHMNTRT